MLEDIIACHRCELHKQQPPLMDKAKTCQVMWVGLSAKIVYNDNEIPLAATTNTGRIIYEVERLCPQIVSYKTNLVKCAPVNKDGKLRYPNNNEISLCINHLNTELETFHPQIVFLLGDKVAKAVCAHLSISYRKWSGFTYFPTEYQGGFYVPVQHPSYIYVYKQKQIGEYVDSLTKMIFAHIKKEEESLK